MVSRKLHLGASPGPGLGGISSTGNQPRHGLRMQLCELMQKDLQHIWLKANSTELEMGNKKLLLHIMFGGNRKGQRISQ